MCRLPKILLKKLVLKKLLLKKNRFTGVTGPSSYLFYDTLTGRLSELDDESVKRYEEKEQ